ncbi:MAG: Uma2 family endonuclease [Polyangiaceae bacterium]
MALLETTDLQRPAPAARPRYVRPPQPLHFPGSEEMPETNRHMELRTALYQILVHELGSRATLGSDQFVYYDPTNPKKKLAPDAFVKLGPPHSVYRVWKTWLRGAPDVAVEVVSDSDEGDEDWATKLERYRAAGIGEVVRFDPDDGERPIRVWDNVEGDLVEREEPEGGLFACTSLGMFWVAVPHPMFVRMLRLARDPEGRDLLPTPVEAEARARQEEARARQEEVRGRVAAEQARDRLEAEVAELRKQLQEKSAGTVHRAAPSPAPRKPIAAPKRAKSPKKTLK